MFQVRLAKSDASFGVKIRDQTIPSTCNQAAVLQERIRSPVNQKGGGVHMRIAVLTVSDGCFSGHRQDKSGKMIIEWIDGSGYDLVERSLLPDEQDLIADRLQRWLILER